MIFTELNNEKCKSYLIGCETEKLAILVDPINSKVDRYLAVLGYHGLKLEFVMDTHTHADHRSALSEMSSLTGCKIARHVLSPQPNTDVHLDDDDELTIGDVSVNVISTPGHSPDSLSLYFEGRVLTGDCLMIGGTGRTDFAGGDAGASYDSIVNKLFTLPDNTLVYPAHDYRGNTESLIGYEKVHNPRLAGKSRDEYIELMTNLGLPLPSKIQEVLQVNASENQDTEIDYPSISELNQVWQVSPAELHFQMGAVQPPVILDVRDPSEYHGDLGQIPGAIQIPLHALPVRYNELEASKDSRIIAVCRAGVRSTTAAAMLTALGFSRVYNLSGGMIAWKRWSPAESEVVE